MSRTPNIDKLPKDDLFKVSEMHAMSSAYLLAALMGEAKLTIEDAYKEMAAYYNGLHEIFAGKLGKVFPASPDDTLQ